MANIKQAAELFKAGDKVEVQLPLPFGRGFDYRVPVGMQLAAGDYVRVPFGRHTETGVVWARGASAIAEAKIKAVYEKLDTPAMPLSMRQFIDWVAWYTCSHRGLVLKMAIPIEEALSPKAVMRYLPAAVAGEKMTDARQRVLALLADGHARMQKEIIDGAAVSAGVVQAMIKGGLLAVASEIEETQPLTPIHYQRPDLSVEQQEAATQLRDAEGFRVALLDGVTGSGKTEVYFDTIDFIVNRPVDSSSGAAPQTLILLPEIALSVQWLERFEKRFGIRPEVWHSDISSAQKKKSWRRIVRGEAQIVVGARSALFLPFANLQLIIVDEEHEPSYKQEEGVMYHARDMAVARAKQEDIPIILVSATPSLETSHNIAQGKFTRLHLPERHGSAVFPSVEVVDMRAFPPDRGQWLAPPLRAAIASTLSAGHQSMLFLNRRGYAPLTLCRTCGYRFECPNCSSWLVMHRTRPRLECHHCGYATAPPAHCPKCEAEDALTPCGPGVERVYEEVKTLFPQARLALMTSDLVATGAQAEALVNAISGREVDIIIGTQMMAKGHHFPGLALVGVVDADLGLQGGDLRAAERTYQLLHQISGRAGREKVTGHVILQSYLPEHPVLKAMLSGDRDAFMASEATMREQAGLPPYGRLAALIIEGNKQEEAFAFARRLAACAPSGQSIHILGPAPAPLFRLRDKYRYRLLLKSPRGTNIQQVLSGWLEKVNIPASVRLKVDIDPYSFL